MNRNTQILGGQTRAIQQRKDAVERYYAAPNKCKYCGKIIVVNDNQKIAEVRKKIFCNQSCTASYNNKTRIYKNKKANIQICENVECGKEFKAVTTRRMRFCSNKCRRDVINVGKLTLLDILTIKGNKYNVSRTIRVNSKYVYFKHTKVIKCVVCGYNKHIEVAHIKSVSSFDKDTKLCDVNSLKNLVGLCPTHHWELDNNKLDSESMNKIEEFVEAISTGSY